MTLQRGYTLLEMALVIIIIGLFVGGIVIAQDIIKNAQLQTIITDVHRFKNAAKLFREKYNYLPGDFPGAETIWGSDASCPAGDITSPWAPRVVTCNGDGNGLVFYDAGGGYSNPIYLSEDEPLRVWQHLANAGFIEGQYSGAVHKGAGFSTYYPGINIPSSKANSRSGFIFFYSAPLDSFGNDPNGVVHPDSFPSEYGHIIEYGGGAGQPLTSTPASQGFYRSPALTAAQSLNIDRKIDDAMPSTGNVLTFQDHVGTSAECHDGATPPAYNVVAGGTTLLCALIFLTGL